jgi:hypothetical protein
MVQIDPIRKHNKFLGMFKPCRKVQKVYVYYLVELLYVVLLSLPPLVIASENLLTDLLGCKYFLVFKELSVQ